MNYRWLLSMSLLVAMLGSGMVGYFLPTAHAATVFAVRINPGGSSGWLTCTWHGACTSPPTAGRALDWGAQYGGAGGTSVYWRSWGYRSDTGSYGTIGTVSVWAENGTCKNVRARPLNGLGADLGRVDYTHTETSYGSWFYIPGNYNNYFLAAAIAAVASDEFQGCKDQGYWTGAHLHQNDAESLYTYQSTSFLTANQNYAITGINDWQYHKSWYY